jgi:hypothetical protein
VAVRTDRVKCGGAWGEEGVTWRGNFVAVVDGPEQRGRKVYDAPIKIGIEQEVCSSTDASPFTVQYVYALNLLLADVIVTVSPSAIGAAGDTSGCPFCCTSTTVVAEVPGTAAFHVNESDWMEPVQQKEYDEGRTSISW